MTYETIARRLEYARVYATERGPEWVREKGLEPLFIRLGMMLLAYADGWIDAGGGFERLQSREMGESYAVEINHLLFIADLID